MNRCLRLQLCCLVAWLAAFPAQAFTTVVIDAGHGGKDPGGYWYGTTEKRLCLDVAKRLQTALQAKGFKTVMTRTTDVYVELSDRAAKANRYRNAIFVSIHFNASRDRSISGFETHYRSTNRRVLAQSIQSAMDRTRFPAPIEASTFAITKCSVPPGLRQRWWSAASSATNENTPTATAQRIARNWRTPSPAVSQR